VVSGHMDYALGVGADTSQGAPNDALEFSASAGGAAFIMGKKNVLAEILDTYSFTSDTPDFWRREYQHYPRHAGRYTGEPAYFKHLMSSAKTMMAKADMQAKDFKYAIFHMPNGKFPLQAGKQLGFTQKQMETGWVVNKMGNTYSGSSPTGLAAVLDVASPGDMILITSFGSGAGSDSFVIKATDLLPAARKKGRSVRSMLDENKHYLTYGQYAAMREKIRMNDIV